MEPLILILQLRNLLIQCVGVVGETPADADTCTPTGPRRSDPTKRRDLVKVTGVSSQLALLPGNLPVILGRTTQRKQPTMLMRQCFNNSDGSSKLSGGSMLRKDITGQHCEPSSRHCHESTRCTTVQFGGPNQGYRPSVYLVYRSAFPLVGVELYPN